MNRTLIEAARTMLSDSLLPMTFWAEAVSTACYIFNRFDGKCDEGFLIGYSLNSKAFRVYNLVTKKVEVNLLIMDDGVVNWGEHTVEEEETNHALMAISSNNENSTCQSNDSEGSFGNPFEHSSESESESISVPNEMSTSKSITANEKVVSESKEVEPKNGKRGFITGNGVAKPVWTNAKRVNHANQFVPRSVQLNAGRPNINYVRPNINTGRTNVNSVRPNINPVRQNVNSVRTNINTVRSKQPVPTNNTNSFSPVRPQGTAVKTSTCYNWSNSRPNSNYNSGSNLVRTDHPLKNMEDRGIFDSGCSGHMTGNKDHLDDFEEYKGGSSM
ncbi:ribonuclease H-like domain-containing protein [Tanacetum coccineum]